MKIFESIETNNGIHIKFQFDGLSVDPIQLSGVIRTKPPRI